MADNLGRKRNTDDSLTNPGADNESRSDQSNGSPPEDIFSSASVNFDYSSAAPQYRNTREYAQALHQWLWQYRTWLAMQSFHWQLMSAMPQQGGLLAPGQTPSAQRSAAPTMGPVRPDQGAAHVGGRPDHRTGTVRQYKLPMLWRRVVAEILDFVLLFYIKILVTVAVLRQMGYMGEYGLDLDVPGHFPGLLDAEDLDYDKLFTFTSELIALEIVNRICITIVETLCIRRGLAGTIGGATPGKKILGLRVISYTSLTESQNGQVSVIGATDPGFFNALMRSVVKNFSMAFFFPACFTVFFFRHNRAAYDVLAKTVVVEVDDRLAL